MSAYIIEKEDAAYLAAMAMAGTSEPGSGGLEWWFGRNGSGRIPEGDLVMAAAAANMLWKENMISVAYRYGDPVEDLPGDHYVDDGITKADVAAQAAVPFEAVHLLKACACYAYQSCEHSGWEASEAFSFIQALKDKAVRALPGYENAEWGAPAEKADKAGAR
jgi:hypothetical protein